MTAEIKTELLPATAANIQRAAKSLAAGELVAFPTETVYGLGADALNPKAVAAIFTAKGRPSQDPLIVHIYRLNQLDLLVNKVPEAALDLMEEFWPGPLTLVLPKTDAVPGSVTSGLGSVAIRMPSHPVALELLRLAGTPIAAPSANLFGHTSPTTAQHVLADLDGRVGIILDGGACSVGVESTVLYLAGESPILLRPGGISLEEIEDVIGPVQVRQRQADDTHGMPSPGMLARHYAPHTPLTFYPKDMNGEAALQSLRVAINQGKRVGILAISEDVERYRASGAVVYDLGAREDHAAIAGQIYAALRWLDSQGLDLLIAHGVPAAGLGLAINDRLSRAAEHLFDQ